MLPQNCLLINLLGSFQQISTGYLPCVDTQWNSWVVLKHIVTPKLCTEYFVRLILPWVKTQWSHWVVLTHYHTPTLCTGLFVRLTLTNLDWVSTMRGHTMFPLNCVQNIKWLTLTIYLIPGFTLVLCTMFLLNCIGISFLCLTHNNVTPKLYTKTIWTQNCTHDHFC